MIYYIQGSRGGINNNYNSYYIEQYYDYALNGYCIRRLAGIGHGQLSLRKKLKYD